MRRKSRQRRWVGYGVNVGYGVYVACGVKVEATMAVGATVAVVVASSSAQSLRQSDPAAIAGVASAAMKTNTVNTIELLVHCNSSMLYAVFGMGCILSKTKPALSAFRPSAVTRSCAS